ncbi:MAG: hypothetical protein Q8R24_04045 [Legionellaceae bacterium]|nr:hypothetical protein [Legionellaceae bacterium]
MPTLRSTIMGMLLNLRSLIALLPYCLIALLPYCLIALLPYMIGV